MIERELAFGSRAKGELGGATVQALVAVPAGDSGLRVWSLVGLASSRASNPVGRVLGGDASATIPTPIQLHILRELGRFGLPARPRTLVSHRHKCRHFLGRRLLRAADVGYYNMAWRLANLPATGIGYIVGRVMFPVYSTLQKDRAAFQAAFLSNVRRVALVSLPVGIGIFLAAHQIVVGIFGERWEPAVAPLEILAIFGLIRAFSGATAPALQAVGKPHLLFVINIVHLAVLCAALFALTPLFGLNGAASAVVIAGVAWFIPAYWLVLRALDLPLRVLIASVERPVVCSVPLIVCLLAVRVPTDRLTPGIQLLLLVISGITVYAGSAFLLARGELRAITAAFRSP